jgi:uncharacterized protein
MDSIIIKHSSHPDLDNPVLIEGLPGVGNVGKLAADHLVDELKAVHFATIYSQFLPPQVLVDDDSVIRLVSNSLYYWKSTKPWQHDIIFLVGDFQGITPEGQYELAMATVDLASEMGVNRIYTLGGYGLGKIVQEPRVLGAATDISMVEDLTEYGLEFSKSDPGSGIVGASGLLLGLGKLKGIEGACLMGETSGYFVDPAAAKAVLQILTKILKVEIEYQKLVEKATQIEDFHASILKDLEQNTEKSPKDLNYIG